MGETSEDRLVVANGVEDVSLVEGERVVVGAGGVVDGDPVLDEGVVHEGVISVGEEGLVLGIGEVAHSVRYLRQVEDADVVGLHCHAFHYCLRLSLLL